MHWYFFERRNQYWFSEALTNNLQESKSHNSLKEKYLKYYGKNKSDVWQSYVHKNTDWNQTNIEHI
jgi:hypothetical protein